MGTEKRERQKANRAKKQAEQARVARTSAVKRNVVRWVLIGVAAFGAVLLIAWIGGAFDSDEPDATIPITLPITLPGSTPIDSTLPGDDTSTNVADVTVPDATTPSATTVAP